MLIWDWNSDKWKEDKAEINIEVSSEDMTLKKKKFSREYSGRRIEVQGPSLRNCPMSRGPSSSDKEEKTQEKQEK